ncbi:pyridine nucleotide-disulfide oxidoreductase [Arthrobacter sp. MYb227]|uniref:FAD-dependent oxidoreductase n=1 Tax=Arthrobacter sp. MYb227 TaxID=1848601 RepID=UPI000CFAEBF9|nr:FAD-dependent oxidoreductase [Arthrobacter sp. MYb227]PQZ87314.1 pyridine nucleotide-disulfide oxidoreductase [Arthrobacter sp. MYb227]
MIGIEELRTVKTFAPLPDEVLGYLATAVEDIHLLPGEYFLHEGDERSLIVVIEGNVEITKVVAGIEKVIGTRKPGQFFGEVPLTLSTKFPAAGRAAGVARIIKLDVAGYYTLATMAPSVPERVGWLARHYLDSLQELAAQAPDAVARVIGPRRDAKVRELATFLTRNHVPFERITVEKPEGGALYPRLEVRDGPSFADPQLRTAAQAVGLEVTPASSDYDVVIVGGGPAGLTAAVNGAAEGLRTVVIEQLAPGGQAGTSSRIENYTGFPYGITGDELAGRALTQAKRLGAEIVVTRTACGIDPDSLEVMLDGGQLLKARAVIMATGVAWRTLGLESTERFLGSGIYYGAAFSDAPLAQGQDICIIGAGNSAGQAAIFFSHHARSVTMLVRGTSLAARMSTYLIDQIEANAAITVKLNTQLVALHGESSLSGIEMLDTANGSSSRLSTPAVFVMIGADAVTDWLPDSIECDKHGFILTGNDLANNGQSLDVGATTQRRHFALETSASGVFAIGDVRSGSVKRVAAGVGEGGMAIAYTHQFLAL